MPSKTQNFAITAKNRTTPKMSVLKRIRREKKGPFDKRMSSQRAQQRKKEQDQGCEARAIGRIRRDFGGTYRGFKLVQAKCKWHRILRQQKGEECHENLEVNELKEKLRVKIQRINGEIVAIFKSDMHKTGQCTFTLDTGSEVSLIKSSALIKSITCSKKKIIVVGINDAFKMKTIGQTRLTLQQDTEKISYNFHIINENIGIETDGLIGLDFLLNYEAKICLKKKKMVLRPVQTREKSRKVNISKIHEDAFKNSDNEPPIIKNLNQIFEANKNEQIIPPFTRTALKIELPRGSKGDYVCLNKQLTNGVHIGNSILSIKNPRVAIINNSENSVKINTRDIVLNLQKANEFRLLYSAVSKYKANSERTEKVLELLNMQPNRTKRIKKIMFRIRKYILHEGRQALTY